MAKIFDFPVEHYTPGVKRMNEDDWFKCHQPLLLQLVNTNEGRDLLCIDKEFPQIVEMGKNFIKGYVGHLGGDKHHFVYDFRIGSKWANIVRYRWMDFRNLAKSFYEVRYNGQILYRPNFLFEGQLVASRATDTFFPDANPETTTVDGTVGVSGASQTFASIRSAAGSLSNDSDTTGNQSMRIDASATTDEYDGMRRSIYLFDTSSLDDSATINSATFSIKHNTVVNQFASTTNLNLSTVNPASNTALVDADYNIANYGSTKLSDTGYSLASITLNTYEDLVLNASGLAEVSTTGVTKLSLRSENDIDNSAPTWGSGDIDTSLVDQADKTGTSDDPKLVIESTVKTFIPRIIMS
jgi:hypothetical protein